MPYIEVYYHIVWSTKNRSPAITNVIEKKIFEYIGLKIFGLGGYLYAINGVSDHLHLIVSVPVTIPIAKFVGQIKAVSSTKINKIFFELGQFRWQSGYSVFSIGRKELKSHIRYVENQKTHHAEGTSQFHLELNNRTDS